MSKIKTIRKKLLTAVLLTGWVGLAACQPQQAEQELLSEQLIAPQTANYKTAQAQNGEFIKTGQGGAELYYPVSAEIALEVSGAHFSECLVQAGDAVKKGDLLAVFSTEDDGLALEELKIQLTRAQQAKVEGEANRETAIEKAQEKLEKVHGRGEKRIAELKIEKQRIEKEEFVYEAEKEIQDLQEQIDELEEKLASCQLTAPFDGIIESVTAFRAGETVNAGDVVVTMYSEEKVLLMVENGEELRYQMEVEVTMQTEEGKKSCTGHVISAPNALAGGAEQSFAVIEVEEAQTADQFGEKIQYFCNLEEIQNVLLADKRAVNSDDGGSYVYVFDQDALHKRYVVTGFSNASQIWILDGLTEGQSLVLD